MTIALFYVIICLEYNNVEWVNMLFYDIIFQQKNQKNKNTGGYAMKKIIICFALIFAGCCLFGKDAGFTLKPEVLTKVVQPGSPLKMTFKWTCPEGYVPKAWRLVAYVPNIPSDFAKVTGNKITPHKMKEWSSVFIMNWIWKIPADKVLEISTAKWPEGDYKMALYILLEARDAQNKVKNKMIAENILFTIKK